MTNRLFLLGLGTGLIVSSLLVFGLLAIEKSPEDSVLSQEVILTQDEIDAKVNAAREEGYEVGKNESSKQQPVSPDSVFIYISKGYSSMEVSALLFEAGLIKDQTAFDALIENQNVERNIKAGVHHIPTDTTEEEIIDIITN